MSRKLLSLLLPVAMLLPGCFTAAGAVTGAGVAHVKSSSTSEGVVLGGMLGLAVDVVVYSLVVSSIPSEAIGREQPN